MNREILYCSVIAAVLLIGAPSIATAQFHPPGEEPPCPCPSQPPCYTCSCPCPPSHTNGNHEEDTTYLSSPDVEFPTIQELFDYYTNRGIEKEEFSVISNASEGTPSDAQVAIAGDSAWVAWLGKISGTNHVFITVSRDAGSTFDKPLQISAEDGGNATNLQLGASDSGRFVDVAWEGEINGTSVIFFSNSMNFGQDFKTYPLNYQPTNPELGNAFNPILEVEGENIILTWEQETISGNQTGPTVLYSHGGRW
jgi:hypothetical protein